VWLPPPVRRLSADPKNALDLGLAWGVVSVADDDLLMTIRDCQEYMLTFEHHKNTVY